MITRRFLGAAVLMVGLAVWVLAAETTGPSREQSLLPARPMRARGRLEPRARVSMSDPNAPIPRASVRELLPPGTDPLLALGVRHQEMTNELAAILKLAQEENAVKTAEALQKLIDKRNAEYKQNLELMQQRRAEMQRRIEQRLRERERSAAVPSGQPLSVEKKEGASQEQSSKN